MARTKQMVRKSDSKGQIPSQSSSGHTLATFPNRQSPRFLDSDSDLEKAVNKFGVKPGNRQKSHQQGDPNTLLHPLVLILVHQHTSLHD